MGATAKIKTSSAGTSGGSGGRDSGSETVSLLGQMLSKLGLLAVLASLKPVVDLISATVSIIAFYLFKFFSLFPAFTDAIKNAYDVGKKIVLDTFGFFKSLFTGEIDVGAFFNSFILKPIKDFGAWVLDNLILLPINNFGTFIKGLFGNPEPFDIIKWFKSILFLDTTGCGSGRGFTTNAGSSATITTGPTSGSSPLMGPGATQQTLGELESYSYISNAIASGLIGGNSLPNAGSGGGTFNFYGMTTDEVVDKVQSVLSLDKNRATRF